VALFDASGAVPGVSRMLPIAPPLLPRGHHNRAFTCQAAVRSNFVTMKTGAVAHLIAAAVAEGWPRGEVRAAITVLSKRSNK